MYRAVRRASYASFPCQLHGVVADERVTFAFRSLAYCAAGEGAMVQVLVLGPIGVTRPDGRPLRLGSPLVQRLIGVALAFVRSRFFTASTIFDSIIGTCL